MADSKINFIHPNIVGQSMNMMVQHILVGILFVGALIYLIVLFKRNLDTKDDGCAKGCGCDTSKAIKDRIRKVSNTEY